jgi:hypothetical protein
LKDSLETHQELRSYFERLGIDCTRPGFYDHPVFAALKSRDPAMLDKYARFVDLRPLSEDELQHSRKIVPLASEFLFQRLRQDGRLSVCVDTSLVLCRLLEQFGIWSYVVKGALTVSFAKSTGLRSATMGTLALPGTPATAGHAWVCAPPYRVVDVTASRQPYPSYGRKIMGSIFVLEESVQPATPEGKDLFDADAVAAFRRQCGYTPTMAEVRELVPNIDEKIAALGAFRVERGRASFKYIGTATSAPKLPLQNMTNLRLSGKLPRELYQDFVASLEAAATSSTTGDSFGNYPAPEPLTEPSPA